MRIKIVKIENINPRTRRVKYRYGGSAHTIEVGIENTPTEILALIKKQIERENNGVLVMAMDGQEYDI